MDKKQTQQPQYNYTAGFQFLGNDIFNTPQHRAYRAQLDRINALVQQIKTSQQSQHRRTR